MTRFNYNPLSTSETILAGLVIFVGAHVLLSSLGLIPTEVSAFNQEVKNAVTRLHTIEYTRSGPSAAPTSQSATAARTVNTTPTLPQAPSALPQRNSGVQPERIIIDKIDVNAPIQNPASTTIPILDKALKKGVVRYPGSGKLGSQRPMFLFGHSSRLPVVQNQAYKSFNGLEELSVGDQITVEGGGEKSTYSVSSVRVVDKDEALVDFSAGKNMLKLSTCTTFGTVENRVVVTAYRQKSL